MSFMLEKLEQTPIIYIMGAGRSGSSILGEAIGMLPRTLHLGEVLGIFDYCSDKSDQIVCSCGKRYENCIFWNSLMSKSFGNNWRDIILNYRVLGKLPSTKKLLIGKFLHQSPNKNVELMYRNNLLLKNALHQTDSKIIIDSSKSIPYAIMMKDSGLFNIFLVHLVRDPRAVLYSWLHRPIQIYNEEKQESILRTRSFLEGILEWIYSDVGAHILRIFGYPFIEILYEDFIENPAETIQNLIESAREHEIGLDESVEAMNILREKKITLHNHWSGGNPRLREKRGLISLKPDNHWIVDRNISEKIFSNLLFSPWLLFYGYFWK